MERIKKTGYGTTLRELAKAFEKEVATANGTGDNSLTSVFRKYEKTWLQFVKKEHLANPGSNLKYRAFYNHIQARAEISTSTHLRLAALIKPASI